MILLDTVLTRVRKSPASMNYPRRVRYIIREFLVDSLIVRIVSAGKRGRWNSGLNGIDADRDRDLGAIASSSESLDPR